MKKTIKFSIPYNGDLDLMKWGIDSGMVYEVYFAGPIGYNFSDPYENAKQFTFKETGSLISLCDKNNIERNLLINKKTMFFEDLKKVRGCVSRLNKFAKIDSITISDPFMLDYIKNEFPYLKLQSSIYMGIDNINKVREALRMGIFNFCLDPAINRCASELRKIMQLKIRHPQMTVKLLGILTCYTNCFFSSVHSQLPINYSILKKSTLKNSKHIFGNKLKPFNCWYKEKNIADEIKRPFIRPEDISFYEKEMLTDYIKVAFRNDNSKLLKDKLTAYFKRSYTGNLFALFDSNKNRDVFCDNKKFPAGFIEKVSNCNKECDSCKYCNIIAKLCLKK